MATFRRSKVQLRGSAASAVSRAHLQRPQARRAASMALAAVQTSSATTPATPSSTAAPASAPTSAPAASLSNNVVPLFRRGAGAFAALRSRREKEQKDLELYRAHARTGMAGAPSLRERRRHLLGGAREEGAPPTARKRPLLAALPFFSPPFFFQLTPPFAPAHPSLFSSVSLSFSTTQQQ